MTQRIILIAVVPIGLLLASGNGAEAAGRDAGLNRLPLDAPGFEVGTGMCPLEPAPRDAAPAAASVDPVCGDQSCEWPEDCANCSQDCACLGYMEQCIDMGIGESRCETCIQASCTYDTECYSPCNNTGTVYCWYNRCWNDDWSACYWNSVCS